MDNSFKTGQYILEVLNDNTDLMELVGTGKIFPLVAKEDTSYPFVVYSRDSVNTQYTKVIGHDNTVLITYRIYSDKYDEALEIANKIRNILERKTITIQDTIRINDIRLLSIFEQFTDDGFLQSLTFTMTVE